MRKATTAAVAMLVASGLASIAVGGNPNGRAVGPEPRAAVPAELRDAMSSLSRPHRADDVLAGPAAHAFAGFAGAAGVRDKAAVASMRVFNSPHNGPVYVVPLRAGAFAVVADDVVAVYQSRLDDSLPITFVGGDPDEVGAGQPATAFGLANDRVVGVDIVAGGESYPATMTTNGWYWQAPTAGVSLDGVKVAVHFNDGRVLLR